jgi:predicted nucleic acid-binding protein
MRVVDSTFPIDVLKSHAGAAALATALATADEPMSIPAPALAEVLVGAHHSGGWLLRETLALVEPFEVIPTDTEVAHEAGRLGAEMLRRGARMSSTDLLVAATCLQGRLVLISRDTAFLEVPGLVVERY